jgi:hypothetical protein
MSDADHVPTLEERKRCPKCHTPGMVVSEVPIPERRGAKLIMMRCMNGTKDKFGPTPDSCVWFLTGWAIQINADGSLYTNNDYNRSRGDKAFPELFKGNTPEELKVIKALQNQLEQETNPGGGEVRRRY